MKKLVSIILILAAAIVGVSKSQYFVHLLNRTTVVQANSPALGTLLEGIVYKDLVILESNGSSKAYYGLFCLSAKMENHDYFKQLFSNSIPRVECGTNSLIFYSDGLIDKETKKPGVIFKAQVLMISNNIAAVNGSWYSGPMASQAIRYNLRLVGTNWVIASKV